MIHRRRMSFQTQQNSPQKGAKKNTMLKFLLTLAAVIAIAAAIPSESDTQGLDFLDLEDSDTENLRLSADESDELDLDDEAAETEGSNRRHSTPMPDGPGHAICMRSCCKQGTYGTPGGPCTSCPENQTSPTTANGIQDSNCKCPNEQKSSCKACGICERFIAATGKCGPKCSAPTRNCKASGPNAGKCT
jgi:hypothetical protein